MRPAAGNKPRSEEKIAITFESLIADVLLPKYLPEITPSEFNGKWHDKYRLITRYRSLGRVDGTTVSYLIMMHKTRLAPVGHYHFPASLS
jgi:hypothetical protein